MMYLNRSFKWMVTLGLLAAVAFSNGAAAAASASCQVLIPSGWGWLSGQDFQYDCASNAASLPAADTQAVRSLTAGGAASASCQAALRQELGTVMPGAWSTDLASQCETLAHMQGISIPTTGGLGNSPSGTVGWRDAGASSRGSTDDSADTGGWRDAGAGGR